MKAAKIYLRKPNDSLTWDKKSKIIFGKWVVKAV